MRAVIQRVSSARVEVEGNTVAAIGMGLCVFLGIHINDTQRDIEYVARKIVNIRLFDTDSGARVSVKAKGYEVLCRSQITLQGTIQGFKISYHKALSPENARPLYQTFLQTIRKEYCPEKVKEGMFQVHSQVHINNDGPLTIILDSHEKNWNHNSYQSAQAKKINSSE